MDDKTFEILAIIAARKSAYYVKVRNTFLAEIKTKNLVPTDIDEKKLRVSLRKVIADLPNDLFLSPEEKTSKKVDPTLKIEKLKLNTNEIVSRVLSNIRH